MSEERLTQEDLAQIKNVVGILEKAFSGLAKDLRKNLRELREDRRRLRDDFKRDLREGQLIYREVTRDIRTHRRRVQKLNPFLYPFHISIVPPRPVIVNYGPGYRRSLPKG